MVFSAALCLLQAYLTAEYMMRAAAKFGPSHHEAQEVRSATFGGCAAGAACVKPAACPQAKRMCFTAFTARYALHLQLLLWRCTKPC
jgi:hypothetical protein